MKNLTTRFRNTYQQYDYHNQDIHTLIALLDIILEMMKIVDYNDSDNMKKLSSFVKLLSSDFCLDIFNTDTIDYIYEEEILPILVHLNDKYETEVQEDPKDIDTLKFDTCTKRLTTDTESSSELDNEDDIEVVDLNNDDTDHIQIHKKLDIREMSNIRNSIKLLLSEKHKLPSAVDTDVGEDLFVRTLLATSARVRQLYDRYFLNQLEDDDSLVEVLDILNSVKISSENIFITYLLNSIYCICELILCSHNNEEHLGIDDTINVYQLLNIEAK